VRRALGRSGAAWYRIVGGDVVLPGDGHPARPDSRPGRAGDRGVRGARCQARRGPGLSRGAAAQPDGELFGTLGALSGRAEPEVLTQALPEVQLVGRFLSTVLGFEHLTQTQSAQTARAWAAAELDQLIGLGNRRGWHRGVLVEDQRWQRYGSHANVLALDVDCLKDVDDACGHGDSAGDQLLQCCAQALIGSSRAR